jgi:hypothetical protein
MIGQRPSRSVRGLARARRLLAGRRSGRAVATSGPLGLFAEHLDPAGGELLGNYPQAFVHAAALSAVVNLARVGVGHAPAAEAAPSWTGHLIPPAGA